MCELTLLGCMGICAVDDIRYKKVKAVYLLVFGIIGIIMKCFSEELDPLDMLFGFSVGMVVYVVAVLSKEQIGKGDALILMVSGIYLGFWCNIFLLYLATTIASIEGIILMLKGQSNMKKKMPFVPYLSVAYVIIMAFRLYEEGWFWLNG